MPKKKPLMNPYPVCQNPPERDRSDDMNDEDGVGEWNIRRWQDDNHQDEDRSRYSAADREASIMDEPDFPDDSDGNGRPDDIDDDTHWY